MTQSRPFRRLPRTLAATAFAVAAVGCTSSNSGSSGLFSPYRVDVPQGNYVDRTMLAQVKEGMTPEQVRFALGTPLLVDPFRPDRWDYVFRFQRPDRSADLRRATVFFENGRVARIETVAVPELDEGSDPALPVYQRRQGRYR